MATFNMLGCCVSRDIFSMHKNDGGHQINQFVNEFSPFFSFENGLEIDYDKYNNVDISSISSNFVKRCTYLDITKNIFNYIKKKNSDYLIVDTGAVRTGYVVFENGITSYAGRISKKIIGYMVEQGIFPSPYEYLNFDYMSLREVEIRTIKYCNELKKMYAVEKIILNEIQHGFLLVDRKNKKITTFSDAYELKKKNRLMSYVFEIMKRELKGCHVIQMLHNVMCDKYHYLGWAPLHFTKGYYDYGLEAINIIISSKSMDEETERLEKCRLKWQKLYAFIFYNILYSNFVNK